MDESFRSFQKLVLDVDLEVASDSLSRMSRLVTPSLWFAGVLALFVAAAPRISSTAASPPPTFDKDVAPILFAHCVSCHRPGEIGSSVPLVSYDDVRPRAEAIKK